MDLKAIKTVLCSIILALLIVVCGKDMAYANNSAPIMLSSMNSIQQRIDIMEEKKDAAHMMAEGARQLGLHEESETILLAKSLWQHYDNESKSLEEELNTLRNSMKYIGTFKLTAYDACMSCCGKTNGITASGAKAQAGVTIAADTRVLPVGTRVYIENVGERVVQDRGGAIKGNKIDVFVNNHSEAHQSIYNQTNAKVWILE